jgi:hypothetical protein
MCTLVFSVSTKQIYKLQYAHFSLVYVHSHPLLYFALHYHINNKPLHLLTITACTPSNHKHHNRAATSPLPSAIPHSTPHPIPTHRHYTPAPPTSSTHHPGGTLGLQHTTHSIQHTAHSTQHTAHSIQHTAYSTQHTAHSIQHTAHSTQHTAHSTQPVVAP